MRFKADIGLAERGFILRQANSANEEAAGHCAQRPTGLKIDLKTETAAQPVFEAITLRAELWSPKNLFQKAEHKGCCKSTSHSKNAIINALHDFFDLTLSSNR